MIPFEFMKIVGEDELDELREAAHNFYLKNTTGRHHWETKDTDKPNETPYHQKLDEWCGKYLGCTYETVACALPDEITVFKAKIDGLGQCNAQTVEYVLDYLYERMLSAAKSHLMKWMERYGILTCPYCNHNFILYDSREDGQVKLNTAQLDHYYPKSKYPILAASFFNLIPSCPNCNLVKSDKPLLFSPYNSELSHNEIMEFRYWHFKVRTDRDKDAEKTMLELLGKSAGFQEDIKLLRLEALYQKHMDMAVEIERKLEILNTGYLDKLAEEFRLNPAELKELAFGARLAPDKFSERPMSKFTYDILKSLE